MNLGGDFLLFVLAVLALSFGPPLIVSIAAWIVGRRRPGSRAAIAWWVAAAILIAVMLMFGPTRRGGWVAAVPTLLVLAIAAPRVFRGRFTSDNE